MTEDEMVGWHHGLNGHEFEQIPGDSEGQGSLACCSPWGSKELDTTEQQLYTEQQQLYTEIVHKFVFSKANPLLHLECSPRMWTHLGS